MADVIIIYILEGVRIYDTLGVSNNLRLQHFYNIFTTNHGWLVTIGSNLNLVLRLLF